MWLKPMIMSMENHVIIRGWLHTVGKPFGFPFQYILLQNHKVVHLYIMYKNSFSSKIKGKTKGASLRGTLWATCFVL